MVKHLIQWVVCLCLCATGINTAWADEATFDFTQIAGFNSWGTGYTERKVKYTEGTVTFSSANKQTGTITDMPVTKGQPVSFVLEKEGMSLTGVEFQCKQWSSKAQTITLKYSTDGGKNYNATNPATTSSNFSLANDSLPEGTNAVQFTFSSSSNQIGIQSLKITYGASNTKTVNIESFTAGKDTIYVFETVETTVKDNRPEWTHAYTYTSLNEDFATVNGKGEITGVAEGTAQIVVSANTSNDENYTSGKEDTLEITVVDNRKLVNLTSFTANETTLTKENTTTTTVSNDQAGWTAKYNYTSSDMSVATVNEIGKITAVGKGKATITVTAVVDADDRGYKAGDTTSLTVNITVNNKKHTVTFLANGQSVSNEAMEEGATIAFNDLEAQYIPAGQTFMGWAAAAFDGTQENAPALVKSATVGTTDVTYYAVFATASTSGNANWVKKTVSEVVANPEAGDYALITPDGNAYNGEINNSGHGQATSTAFTSFPTATAPDGTCLLTISRKGENGIEIARKDNGEVIYASKNSSGGFKEGTSNSFWVASKDGKNLIFKANSAYLRAYDNNSFRTYGSANFAEVAFAYRSSVTYTNYCTTVGGEDTREFVKFTAWNTSNGETTLVKGNPLTTVATLNPAECTTGTITYTSNNPEVATIAADGVITAVGKGEATLVATLSIAEDDAKYRLSQENTQTLTINVVNPEHTVTFMADGKMVEEKNVREEEAFSFPAVTAPEGLVFIGWTEKGLKGMATEAPALVDTTATVMGEYDLTFVAVYARVAQKGEIKQYELTADMIKEHFTQTAQAYGDDERSWSNDAVTWRFKGQSVKDGDYFQINHKPDDDPHIAFTTPCAIKNIAFDVLNGSNKDYTGYIYIYDFTTDEDVTTASPNGKEASIAIDGNYNNLAIQSSAAARIKNIVLTCQDEDRYLGYVTDSEDAKTSRTHVVTVADSGYTTVCLPYNAVAPEGAKFFALKSVDNAGLHFVSTETLVAGQGYVLQGKAGEKYTLKEVTEAVDYNVNILKGVVEQTNLVDLGFTGKDDYNYPWILAKDGTFKRYTGAYIPAGKAYLDGALLQNLGESGAATMRVIFEEATNGQETGLSQLSDKSESNACYYNLQGQRIAQPTQPGVLYIEQSGRKLILRK